MTDDDLSKDSWRAPYMSYGTLVNFLENKIGGGAVPPRIDRPFLDKYAGSVQLLLIATLKTLGMIDEDNAVLEPLRVAVRSPESRKAVLRSWAGQFYREQIDLAAENATAQMLWETFSKRGFNGSTLRRAVIFYLALAADIDLPVSAFFKPPKAPASAPESRKRIKDPLPDPGPANGDVPPSASRGNTHGLTLDSGAKIEMTVTMDVMETSVEDRQFIFELIDKLKGYNTEPSAAGRPAAAAPSAGGGGDMT